MSHPLCALCEGLDHCRIMDCHEVIPNGQALCRPCEAALADAFAPEDPANPFTDTPEPWGRTGPICAHLSI